MELGCFFVLAPMPFALSDVLRQNLVELFYIIFGMRDRRIVARDDTGKRKPRQEPRKKGGLPAQGQGFEAAAYVVLDVPFEVV